MTSEIRPLRLFLLGFYGRGNFGDDLMCRSAATALSASTRRISIAAASPRAFTDLAAQGIEITPRTPISVIRGIWRTDIVIQAGGTIFHDSYRGKAYWRYLVNLLLWLVLFAYARLLGKRVLVIGAGIGPLRTRAAQKLVKAALSLAAFLTVRDRPSREAAEALGLRTGVAEGADLAFLGMPTEFRRAQQIIGVSACDLSRFGSTGDPVSFWRELAKALSSYCRDRKLKVRLFALYADGSAIDDRRTIESLARHLDEAVVLDSHVYADDPADTLSRIAECDAFIATRYHAAVAALIARRPIAVIPYNRKVVDLAAQVAVPPSHIIAPEAQPAETAWHAVFDSLLASPPAQCGSELNEATSRAIAQALAATGTPP